MVAIILLYLALFLGVFFSPEKIGLTTVLSLTLGLRILVLIVYLLTVISLYRKFSYLPEIAQKTEI